MMHGQKNIKIYSRVGLYKFVVITPWRWHLCAEICRSLCTPCVLYHQMHFFWIMMIVRKFMSRTT